VSSSISAARYRLLFELLRLGCLRDSICSLSSSNESFGHQHGIWEYITGADNVQRPKCPGTDSKI
jgi:hypothetical protein